MKKVFSLLTIFLSIFICSKVYAYKSYKIGDKVTYNDIDFYVIKDSSSDSDYVTLLKKEPLTVDEVNKYGGVGTNNNHVNRYISKSQGLTIDIKGYGGVVFYSSETCGNIDETWINSSCINNYIDSDIKYIVDAWSSDKFLETVIKSSRLVNINELVLEKREKCPGYRPCYEESILKYDWMYDDYYSYWVMPSDENSSESTNMVNCNGTIGVAAVNGNYGGLQNVVRPVVEIYKCALDNSCIDENEVKDNDTTLNSDTSININNESKEEVKVPNTLKSVSGLVILIGIVLVCVGLNIFMIVKNRSNK